MAVPPDYTVQYSRLDNGHRISSALRVCICVHYGVNFRAMCMEIGRGLWLWFCDLDGARAIGDWLLREVVDCSFVFVMMCMQIEIVINCRKGTRLHCHLISIESIHTLGE